MDPVLANDWHVVARSAEVIEGAVHKARLLGQDLVLWRHQGAAMAWLDHCFHRGMPFSKGWVENGEVVCPYHGWRYDREGRCTALPAHPGVAPPARARAVVYRVVERYGLVWVCLGEPAHDVPLLAEWEDEAFISVHSGPYALRANGFRVIENVLDCTHFPFVHRGLLGDAARPDSIPEYQVTRRPRGLSTSEIVVRQPSGDHRGGAATAGYTYHCLAPLTAYLMKSIDQKRRFSQFMPVTPLAEDACLLWVITSANFELEGAAHKIRERNDQIFTQDKPIVENQRPKLLPLDLKAEMHAGADKFSVAYRRWLGELGVTFGVLP